MSLILVTGGTRCGKSRWAQRCVTAQAEASGGSVTFIATAQIQDMGMRLQVAQLRKTRPRTWKTIEAPRSIAAAILSRGQLNEDSVLLLDDVPMLVSNVLNEGDPPPDAAKAEASVQAELRSVLRIIRERGATIVIVTGELGSGLPPTGERERLFLDLVGRTNQWLAAQADAVWLVASGLALPLHGLGERVEHKT